MTTGCQAPQVERANYMLKCPYNLAHIFSFRTLGAYDALLPAHPMHGNS